MADDCKTCEDRNPVTPIYTRAAPLNNENCVTCGNPNSNFFQAPPVSGKTTEILAGTQIGVTDLSDLLVDRFRIDWIPVVDLTVDLVLISYAAGVPKPNLVLWGTTLDQFELTWTYNKTPIFSQLLSNDAGLLPSITNPTSRSASYINENILNQDVKFTITGNDGTGLSGAIATDTNSALFGNYRVWGVGARVDQGTTNYTTFKAFVEQLIASDGTTELTSLRTKSDLFGEGDVLEHFFYCYPKDWGFATFTKNNIPGGFKRLKKVGQFIQVATNDFSEDGDEEDIIINNGNGANGDQAFRCYQSTSDNIDDQVTPIIVS